MSRNMTSAPEPVMRSSALEGIESLPDRLDVAETRQHDRQALDRETLVVDDEGADHPSAILTCGIDIRTSIPPSAVVVAEKE